LETTLGEEHHRAVLPPSTRYDAPVMNDALSDARNMMVWAISSGLPIRLSGTVAASPAFLSAVPVKRFNIPVSIGPGATKFTRTPDAAASSAADLVSPSMSVAEKKGTKMAAKWPPAKRAVWSEPFPLLRVLFWNGPQAVKGAPLLGAAQRTLDGEDRSEMIAEEGKAGRTFGEKWSAILVPSPTASNKCKHNVEILCRQQFGLPFGQPLGADRGLTLRTTPISTRVIRDGAMSALIALVNMAT
jgi:hypothetical protein